MMRIEVSGMTCGHCARAVTQAVEALPAVERALVDLGAGMVSVEGAVDAAAVRAAIEAEGYEVRAVTAV
jgi:copper chaperone